MKNRLEELRKEQGIRQEEHVEALIIGMLFLLFCFQCIVWTIAFRRLEKRM